MYEGRFAYALEEEVPRGKEEVRFYLSEQRVCEREGRTGVAGARKGVNLRVRGGGGG